MGERKVTVGKPVRMNDFIVNVGEAVVVGDRPDRSSWTLPGNRAGSGGAAGPLLAWR